ncbi:hypothetical protein DKX38_018811 [Salix brachista]|uniref:Uncharacterized protein n=1 Tax=Salix brachista TaxID=2182728 RepID=A0A5N5KP69_9ROSI|nr:hypothetical protein DKX38_018811 [Salix brachista]
MVGRKPLVCSFPAGFRYRPGRSNPYMLSIWILKCGNSSSSDLIQPGNENDLLSWIMCFIVTLKTTIMKWIFFLHLIWSRKNWLNTL